jgi:hypothetical protein
LDYDVSIDEVVELIVVIPMSPSSSKTESGCKGYHRFRIDVFFLAESLAPGPARPDSRPEKSSGAPNRTNEELFGDHQTVRPKIRRHRTYGRTSS